MSDHRGIGVTADDPFGEPWPPDGSCSIVRRTTNGFTLWRRIKFPKPAHTQRRQRRAHHPSAAMRKS